MAGLERLEARSLLAVNPLNSIPALHSDPGAPASLYLDFDGHFEPVWGSYTNVTSPAYDVDGDALTFSDHELANIHDIWAAVSEDFAPFNIDVTTVEPAVLAPGVPINDANGIAERVAIGGTPDVLGMGGGLAGYSYINSFTSSVANVSFVFPENITSRDTPATMESFISHEAGHAFGLQHQSTYNADGTKHSEYNPGDLKTWAPIMGTIFSPAQTTVWYYGTNSLGATVYQDDMAVLAGPADGFGYRADDHGNTTGSATPLSQAGATWSGSGIVGTNTDVDMFSFTVATEDTYRLAASAAAVGPNLDAVVELRDAGGQLIETASPTDSLDAAIVRDLAPGNYFLAVRSTGTYGWIGQYTVGIDTPPAAINVIPASNRMTTGEDGRSTSFQVALGTQPLADVVIPITSSKPTEGTVSTSSLVFTPADWNIPQTVTITGVADGVVDGDAGYSAILGAAISTDADYSGFDAHDVGLVNIDSDAAGFVYETDSTLDSVERRRLDGTGAEPLVDLKGSFGDTVNYVPRGIAVDQASGKIYWADSTTHVIYRANVDGSSPEAILSTTAEAIALDSGAGKLYWTDQAANTIQRANLDGTNVEVVISAPSGNPRGIALDLSAGQIYWTDSVLQTINRANLNGTNAEILWTGSAASTVVTIALDVAAGRMYWTDPSEDLIRRANLDGSNVEVVVDAASFGAQTSVYGLALDVPAGKLYWTDTSTSALYRANLDGSMAVALASGVHSFGIAVAPPKPDISVTHRTGLVTTEAGGTDLVRVSLNTRPTANVTIPVSSGDPTEGTISTSSLTFTPDNWNVPQVVTITGVDDSVVDGDITYSIVLGTAASADPAYNGVDPADASVTNTDNDTPVTKFYVVDDASTDRTYEYDPSGSAVENDALASGNTAPRGAASTAAGDKVWVVDANKHVYVYDTAGALLGSWSAGSLSSRAMVEGIATNGTDVWIVDAKQDRVYRYAGAASRLSGSQGAASSFALNSGNTSPKDLVTDGTYLWVVNDSTTDKVFKYTLSGSLVGSWTIAGAGSSPTGITLDPTNVSALWVVDRGTRRVYQFDNAAGRVSGSQSPSSFFALAPGNTNPQGIADPPPARSRTQGTFVPGTTGTLSSFVPLSPPAEQDLTSLATELLQSGSKHPRGFPRR